MTDTPTTSGNEERFLVTLRDTGNDIRGLIETNPTSVLAPSTLQHNALAALDRACSALGVDDDTAPSWLIAVLSDQALLATAHARLADFCTELETQFGSAAILAQARSSLRSLIARTEARVHGGALLAFAEMIPPRDSTYTGPLRARDVETVFQDSGGPRTLIRRFCEPFASFNEYRFATGEARACAALRSAHALVESTYIPYVRALRILDSIANDDWPGFADFGVLLDQVHGRLAAPHPGLVDLRLSTLRNAYAHQQWRYLPDTDEIEYWDRRVPPARLGVTELAETIVGPAFLTVATVFVPAAMAYALRTGLLDSCFFDFAPEFLPVWQSADPVQREAARAAFAAWADASFGDLRTLVRARAQT
jgi:hypothetical protein